MLSFFIGKGGVGKTTVGSSFALHLARSHPREPVLLLSTDPAHSLADVFNIKSLDSNRPRRLKTSRGNLSLWQIDARNEFDKFLARYREPMLQAIEQGTIFTRDEIAPLLSTTLPGMAEFAALLAISNALAARRFAHIVVDTAPFGHTIRLFEMPAHFRRFLDFLDLAASRDRILASRFGGSGAISYPFLSEWQQLIARIQHALTSAGSRLVLVTTPESFSLNEAARVARQLHRGPARLKITDVVLNRAIASTKKEKKEKKDAVILNDGGLPRVLSSAGNRSEGSGFCSSCNNRLRETKKARRFLKSNFPRVPILLAGDSGAPPLGIPALTAFAEHIFSRKPLPRPQLPSLSRVRIAFKPAAWPSLHAPLTLTLGKGGVGKTTISSGLAFHHRRANPAARVVICSTDPAPSLDDVFRRAVTDDPAPVLGDRNLLAAELDAVAEFRAWSAAMREKIQGAFSTQSSGGIHVDLSFDREIFSALLDVVPPGVDELFAIFRILDLLESSRGRARLVIDMAPTGHALELLRMPDRLLMWSRLLMKILAAHRELPLAQDAAVEIARVSQRVRSLAAMLKNRKQSAFAVVMLPEPLPDRETQRLLHDLKALVAPPLRERTRGQDGDANRAFHLFINRVFLEEHLRCPRCRLAQAWQHATLARIVRSLGSNSRLSIIRDFGRELSGRSGLQSLTRELWQLASAPAAPEARKAARPVTRAPSRVPPRKNRTAPRRKKPALAR